MKIQSVRIENFRGFRDAEISFEDYTCFVGRNGSGKSTVIQALNVFFRQHKDTATDLSRLSQDDFHHKKTDQPIRITVTFDQLSDSASADLKDYVRQGKLVVSAVATFDPQTGTAKVTQHGSRLGMPAFKVYFEADKATKSAAELKAIFAKLRSEHEGIAAATSKADMAAALRDFESARPDECELLLSPDEFYGATRGAGKLAPHIQWVFVSATKDVSEEAEEAKDSGLGQLLARTIRSKIDFSGKVDTLRKDFQAKYQEMLNLEESSLSDLSKSLQERLRNWAHPSASASIRWKQDLAKSVRIEEPMATIRLGERGFTGELARFGHGLQRSYLLALLQEISALGSESEPTLIMGIEEPELYQHPPQARYLAAVLRSLSSGNAQVLCCTHSPLFIPGDGFESVRVVRESGEPCASDISQVRYSLIAAQLEAAGENLLTESGMMARLYPTLNPVINEMFFCNRLILVEGIEDLAYISTYIELCDLGLEYRKWGCHMVPAGGKSSMVKPLAIANQLNLPTFVIFDADTHETKPEAVSKHKRDNRMLQILLGVEQPDEWPEHDIESHHFRIWSAEMTDVVPTDIGPDWAISKNKAESRYGHAPGLMKNPLAIAYALQHAWTAGRKSDTLETLVRTIVGWAASP